MFNLEQIITENKDLLAKLPKRSSILKSLRGLKPTGKVLRLQVIRSMPFEFITDSLNCYLGRLNMSSEIQYSSYDPALSSAYSYDGDGDAVIFWVDWRLHKEMSPAEVSSWIQSLLSAIRSKTDAPILFNNWVSSFEKYSMIQEPTVSSDRWVALMNAVVAKEVESQKGCYVADLNSLLRLSDIAVWDQRNDHLSAFPFSDQSAILMGRFLANSVFANLFSNRMKAIIVDLDNTLYNGVLGEGVDTLIINDNHREFHRLLKFLSQSGILLGLCSKNELKDVEDFFASAPLSISLSDFASVKVSWNPKAAAISEMLEDFNFGSKDVLFIDDNPTELVQVKGAHPEISLIQADSDGQLTSLQLLNFPRIYQLAQDASADKRMRDIKANQERKKIEKQSGNHGDYLKQLGMQVGIFVNESSHVNRVYSLSNKTNQFNLTFSRFTEAHTQELASGANQTFTVTLKDKFADSGIVGAFVFCDNGESYQLEEVLYSCRALGRDVEYSSFLQILEFLQPKKSYITVRKVVGERNTPALKWFDYIFKTEGTHKISDLIAYLNERIDGSSIEINWSGNDK